MSTVRIDTLTPHETAVLAAAAIGLTYAATGRRLGMSESTARRRAETAIKKLGAANLIHAVALVAEAGLLNAQHLRARTLPPTPPYDRSEALRDAQLRRALLTPQRAAEAAKLRAQGWSYRDIAARYGVAYETARRVLQTRDRGAAA